MNADPQPWVYVIYTIDGLLIMVRIGPSRVPRRKKEEFLLLNGVKKGSQTRIRNKTTGCTPG